MNTLIRLAFETLGPKLEPFGFNAVRREQSFFRHADGRRDRFHLIMLTSGDTALEPTIGVRWDAVESIFHRTSGFTEGRKATDTVGVHLRNVYGGAGYHLILRSESDIAKATSRLLDIFHMHAEPYYERYTTLAEVDCSLNDRPREKAVHTIASLDRCCKGLIVAKLVGRDNYDELVSVYREKMRHDAKGFYLPWFEALVKDLETLDIRSQSKRA